MHMVGFELPLLPLTRIADAGSSKESARRVGKLSAFHYVANQLTFAPNLHKHFFCSFNQVINREQAYFVKLLAEKSL